MKVFQRIFFSHFGGRIKNSQNENRSGAETQSPAQLNHRIMQKTRRQNSSTTQRYRGTHKFHKLALLVALVLIS